MSFLTSVEHEVAVVFGDVQKAEETVRVEVGKFRTYIAAHPSLAADLEKFVSPVATYFKDELSKAEKSGDLTAVLYALLPGAVKVIEGQVTAPGNAIAIALQVAGWLASAGTAAAGSAAL